MFVFKRIPNLFIETFSYLLTEHIDISLIDFLALINQFNRIINPNILQFLNILIPKLIKYKQQLLCPASREHGQKALAPPLDNFLDLLPKILFPYIPTLMHTDSEGTL